MTASRQSFEPEPEPDAEPDASGDVPLGASTSGEAAASGPVPPPGGLLLVVLSMTEAGDQLEAWSVRGLFFIIGGIVIFALTIQSLGLIVAGPAAMVFGSMASPEFRWLEAVIFSVVLTAICILLFKTLLGLPIPVVTFW